MKIRNSFKTASVAAGVVLLAAPPAFATTIPVPEPSMLSIYGLAAAGLVIAGRWLRRK